MTIIKSLFLNSAKRLEEFQDFASDEMNDVYIIGSIRHTDNGDYHMDIKYNVSDVSKMESLLEKWYKEDNIIKRKDNPFFEFLKKLKF